ncbi:MAG: hypothetical protein HFH53_08690 [Hespellia sp.]|nr:hypothetical protein [Hespellia sp.]
MKTDERRSDLSRRILAICDSEPAYAKNLMERICLNKNVQLQVRVFSDAGQLFQFGKKHKIDLLLMEDSYPEEMRRKIPAKNRFLLARELPRRSSEQENVILKYQSAEQILRQLLQTCGELSSGRNTRLFDDGRRQLIGVYSPVHRIGKTKFALELGEELGKEAPALYLNLEEYAGLEYYLPIQEEGHLGDLLYYLKQEQESFGFRLSTMVSQLGGLDYVQPVPVTKDIRAVDPQEWMELLRQIMENSIYKSVILDLGESIQGLYEILRICDTVYTLYIEESGARAKLKQYTDNLQKLGYEDVLEHTVQKVQVCR